MEDHYPTADLEFIISMIKGCDKVQGVVRAGNSTAYILKGDQPIGNRTIVINEMGGQVPYYFATGTALKLKTNNLLMEWFEKNRNWKEGAYFVNTSVNSPDPNQN